MDEDEMLYREMNEEDGFYMGNRLGDRASSRTYSSSSAKTTRTQEGPNGCALGCVVLFWVFCILFMIIGTYFEITGEMPFDKKSKEAAVSNIITPDPLPVNESPSSSYNSFQGSFASETPSSVSVENSSSAPNQNKSKVESQSHKPSKAYFEGYDNGYEDGSNHDRNATYRPKKKDKKYLEDYDEGYREGYYDGYMDYVEDYDGEYDDDDEDW